MIEDELPNRAAVIGKAVRDALVHPLISEIRGRGAMLGMMLRDAEVTARVVRRCLDDGVLLGWTLHSDSLVRIAPPLTIEESVLGEALAVIRRALDHEYPARP